MEVIKSVSTAYGYTIKDNRSETTDYQSWFDKADKMGCKFETKHAEYGSSNKLHYHGIVQIPKGFYRKRLMQKGLHLKLEELFDRAGWEQYCKKEEVEPLTPVEERIVVPKEKLF